MSDRRPVLFVTNIVPPDRAGAFQALHEIENIELALFGGRSHHATGPVDDPGVPHRHVRQRQIGRLARSGRYRAVVCGTAGRIALPASWRGARRAGVPFVLWSALWAHPRTPAHRLLGTPLLRRIYRDADAVVTYGPHVTEFVLQHGARAIAEAPQSVDNEFWGAKIEKPERLAPFTVLFVGRAARYKGEPELLEAWRRSGLTPPAATLGLVGERGPEAGALPPGVKALGAADPERLRRLYAGADLLVMPAIDDPQIREPWGLVANEAMAAGVPVLATDAVGAAAGGLVRSGDTGLVVPAGDPRALASAMAELAADESRRRSLGEAARNHVAAYTFQSWAAGMSHGFRLAGAGRSGDAGRAPR